MALLVAPGLAAAHPLGNFTINHYAGIRVEPERVVLDVVIDQAEIPAFQARLALDGDGDGEVSEPEREAGRLAECQELAPTLALTVGDQPQALQLVEAGLSFPDGAAGLATMRSVCVFVAGLARPLEAGVRIDFVDTSYRERIGWREIVVQGSGVLVASASEAELRSATESQRLLAYPDAAAGRTLNDASAQIVVTPGGPTLPALDVRDADPVPGAAPPVTGSAPQAPSAAAGASPNAAPAAVPGRVGVGDLPSVFRTADLTPLVLLVSIVTAAGLGAGHALTPGHGKTLMAAYLVGTRGSPVHAVGLGLSVALSHTLGILALALLVVGAEGLLPPDLVVTAAPVVAAISIVAIGGWMVLGELRRRRPRDHEHAPGHTHDHPHAHDPAHADAEHHGRGHDHDHGHLPLAGTTITWRSLFVLGLAGGLIPSASALLILLGSIAAGRPAFGFVLVVAFGLGMAAVMGAIGVALVLARGRLDRVDDSSWFGRGRVHLPLVASFLVLGFGIYLTVQAVSGTAAL